jgi:tetratricopeptide (TPR) repeat protein
MSVKTLPKLILLTGALFIMSNVHAKTDETDSLLHLLKVAPEKEMAFIYNELSFLSSGSNFEQSLQYGKKALLASEEHNQLTEQFKALANIAYAFDRMDSAGKALEYYNSALNTAQRLSDTLLMARACYEKGTVYTKQGLYEKALENLIHSLRYLEMYNEKNPSTVNERHLSFIANNIGVVFTRMGDNNKAMDYYQYSLKVRRKLNDSLSIANMLNNIGILYADEKKFDTAAMYYNEALEIERKAGDSLSIAETLLNKWEVMIHKKQYQRAVAYFDTVKSYTSFLNARHKAVIAHNIAMIWLALNKPEAAYPYIKREIELTKRTNMLSRLGNSYLLLSDYYAQKSDFKRAYQYQKKYIEINDSVMNSEVASKLAEMQTRYETEKKEKQIALLEKDKQLTRAEADRQRSLKIIYLIVSLVVILLAGFVIFEIRNKLRRKQHQLEKRNLENEQKLLRVQMNPHFIFNSLNTVQGFISGNDSFKAMSFLSKFGQLLRNILENSRKNMITLENELETLSLYLDMEKQRANNRFDYSIKTSHTIDPESVLVPPLIIQPFAENAIKHGFKTENRKGELNIEVEKENNLLILTITDNGIGRQKAEAIAGTSGNKHKSLGMRLTAERLKNTGKATGSKTSFQIIDLKNDKGEPAGTKVIVTLPFVTR